MARLVALLIAQLPADELCLEIGIGTGRIALPLVEAGVHVVGVDVSTEMLRKLVEKTTTDWPQIAVSDATRLPFGDATFGSAIAAHVLHLIPEWRTAVAEVVRVTRPGGLFLASRGGADRPQWYQDVVGHFFHECGDPPWPPGAASIEVVDSHMRQLAVTPRSLANLGLETQVSIDHVISDMERGYWAACWTIDSDVRREAARRTREWAERGFGDITAVLHTSWESSTWHAYDLPE